MIKRVSRIVGLACLTIIVAGCSAIFQPDETAADGVPAAESSGQTQIRASLNPAEAKAAPDSGINSAEQAATASPDKADPAGSAAELLDIPQPVNELDEGNYRWNQLLGRDSIQPIYEPRFSSVDEAPYVDDELVIGVQINGEAKAYAIGPLNGREMVNDTVGGVPILVTW